MISRRSVFLEISLCDFIEEAFLEIFLCDFIEVFLENFLCNFIEGSVLGDFSL